MIETVSQPEALQALGVDSERLMALVISGKIRAVRHAGGHVRLDKADVDRLRGPATAEAA